jgi:hypothetical protein
VAPVEQAKLPRIVGQPAVMCGAARGEHIARERVCSNIEERPVRNPRRVAFWRWVHPRCQDASRRLIETLEHRLAFLRVRAEVQERSWGGIPGEVFVPRP